MLLLILVKVFIIHLEFSEREEFHIDELCIILRTYQSEILMNILAHTKI